MKNGQKEFFIKWQNFPHSEWTWDPEGNISPKAIIESISKKVQIRESATIQMLVPMFNLLDKITRVQKYFEVGKDFISPYWYDLL